MKLADKLNDLLEKEEKKLTPNEMKTVTNKINDGSYSDIQMHYNSSKGEYRKWLDDVMTKKAKYLLVYKSDKFSSNPKTFMVAIDDNKKYVDAYSGKNR
jgi:hypothetical protein